MNNNGNRTNNSNNNMKNSIQKKQANYHIILIKSKLLEINTFVKEIYHLFK